MSLTMVPRLLVLCGLIIISTILNPQLVTALRKDYAMLSTRSYIRPFLPPLDYQFRDLTGTAPDGAAVTVSLRTGPPLVGTVLVFYRSGEFWSDVNWPNWSALTNAFDQRRWQTMFVHLGGTASPWAGLSAVANPRARFVTGVSPELLRSAGLNISPVTMVLDPDGRVKWIRAGELREEERGTLLSMVRGRT